MAGIDKIVGTQEQLLEFRAWLEVHNPDILEMVAPVEHDWLGRNPKTAKRTISNFPVWADKWLYKHCPIKFITDRIHEQYDGDPNNP